MLLASCVSSKKYKEMSARNDECNVRYSSLSSDYSMLQTMYTSLGIQASEYEKLTEEELDALHASLKKRMQDLEIANNKVLQLQQTIQNQRAAQQELLSRVRDALVGFTTEELTIELRDDGKVYVSLSEKLLFKTGKWDVDPKGKQALSKVADVLKQQPDIQIEVEGHTDNVPLKGSVVKDNWDLSVMRATSIVRVLTAEYGVNPQQVIAVGRGEYFPVATNETDEGKQRNRRTEIILSPKISDLIQIVEGN
jgi:chemotaxis protein MotB